MNELPDTRRIIGNIIRFGTIERVDRADATCRVQLGEIVTGDIPWIAQRAGGTIHWSPPTIGEQCILFCPEGDTDAGVVLLGAYSDQFPAPSTEQVDLVQYADGAVISYDAAAHRLLAILPGGGEAEVTAPGGVTITGDVKIDGKLSVTGEVKSDADVKAGSISLKDHLHGKVQAGAAKTDKPE